MNQVPNARVPVRMFNRIAGFGHRLGLSSAGLEPESLIAQARKNTGLEDFGADGPHREALNRLAHSLDTEAQLTPLGRIAARGYLLRGLQVQLELQDWFNRYPEIAEQQIERPVFIIGMPRTGTTIQHELLALDPNNRIPQAWEVDFPFPPPQRESYDHDPRIRKEEKQIAVSHYLIPDVKRMHRMGAQLPQECVAITGYAFTSMLFSTIYRLPSYNHWLYHEADLAPAYAFHRRFLQLLQWRCPGRRWVLKSPGHLWALPALLGEYPDACLIQSHRDPLKIIGSLCSLVPTLRSMASDCIDVGEVAREWSQASSVSLNASMTSRDSGLIDPQQIIDIQFDEFMSSQSGAIAKVYKHFGFEFSPAFADSIERYIAENPADKHGSHKYRFEDTGLNIEQERAKVQAYQDYFGVRSEL